MIYTYSSNASSYIIVEMSVIIGICSGDVRRHCCVSSPSAVTVKHASAGVLTTVKHASAGVLTTVMHASTGVLTTVMHASAGILTSVMHASPGILTTALPVFLFPRSSPPWPQRQ